MTGNPYQQLQDFFHVRPDHRGWCHAEICPFCGKNNKHFGFNELGYKCVVCGAHGGLSKLAQHVRISDAQPIWTPPVQRPPKERPWAADAMSRLVTAMKHPERNAAWAAYKPLSVATLNRHLLGYGPLPFRGEYGWYESRDNWLIVPLFQDGQIVGLRGRNLHADAEPKWISATGTDYTLYGVEDVQPESVCWMCENYVDALWLRQQHPEQSAVALGGATTWQHAWGVKLAARNPKLVVVALDNDLAGQASGSMLTALKAEWHAVNPTLPEPTTWLAGPKIANELLALGLTVRLFEWPVHAPAKAGVDWLLEQEE